MLAIGLLDPKPGELICDLCASPGGKSTAILEALGGSGGVLANEAIRSRTDALRLNLARQGASRWVVSSMDPEDLADLMEGTCDAVLADVPCSGQSLVGSGKQKVSCFDPKLVAHAAGRQGRILASAARLLRPGGRLVYSTCTFSWQENEDRVMGFLAGNPEFELAPDERLTGWQSPSPAPEGCYRLWPDKDRSAGAFAARLMKRGGSVPGRPAVFQRQARGRRVGRRAETGGNPPWQEWGMWRGEVELVSFERYRVAAIPADMPAALRGVIEAGQAAGLPEAAQQFGKVWQPAYGLAMRRDGAFSASQAVDLSDDAARAYLRGESVRTGLRGWAVATWRGWPLGWLHGSGHAASNKLDKAARLNSVQ